MSISSTARRAAALILSGGAIGGALGYAASASGTGVTRTGSGQDMRRGERGARTKAGRARLKHAVSITAVVPTGGGKFATVSIARGVLVDTASNAVTLREGTPRATYKTVTLPLGADTRVRLSEQRSSIGALSAGDRVTVIEGPHGTTIVARPSKAKQPSNTTSLSPESPEAATSSS